VTIAQVSSVKCQVSTVVLLLSVCLTICTDIYYIDLYKFVVIIKYILAGESADERKNLFILYRKSSPAAV